MSEQFRDCFVGEQGYDALKKVMKTGNDVCIDLGKCLQERYDAELVYVRALRKTTDTLNKISGGTKGSLLKALNAIATQTDIEGDAHTLIGNTLLNQISIPLKNLAENQAKDRKLIEETLNEKLKNWRHKKDCDNKHRTRQFEKSKEIETLNMKISEPAKSSKISTRETAKESILSTPLIMGCVLPGGRYSNSSEKLETALQKAEEELEKIERKYHHSTKDVELARQTWDAELCRTCDRMEKMEFDRMTELEKSIQIYAEAMRAIGETMHQVSQKLDSIRISPADDIIVQARSNVRTTEIEILLYDIFAENNGNIMSEQRRILSLMRWMDKLRKDINVQRPMKEDTAVNADRSRRDASSSSSNDDDGAMNRHSKEKKREKKIREGSENTNQTKPFANDVLINRQSAYLFRCLYEGSLYKIEKIYNDLKGLPAPSFEHSERFAKSFNDKGNPTTFLRIPIQSMTHTPPSAPSATRYFAEAMPMYTAPVMPPMAYTIQYMPMMNLPINEVQHEASAPPAYQATRQHFILPSETRVHSRMVTNAPPYPVAQPMMTRSDPHIQQQRVEKHVQATHPYVRKRDDELTIYPGDKILLLERRSDGWCQGKLKTKIGLFPGNYVKEL